MLERKEQKITEKERERKGYASEKVERLKQKKDG
jgi:hypothetical protein